jgi:hypothetical protein
MKISMSPEYTKKHAMTGAACSSFTEKDYYPTDAITR